MKRRLFLRLWWLIPVVLSAALPLRAQSDELDLVLGQAITARGMKMLDAARRDGEWAVATAAAQDGDGSLLPATPLLAIARREAGAWQVLLPSRADASRYNLWLGALPEALASADDKSVLHLFEPGENAALQTTVYNGYRMPYPAPWSAFVTQGPDTNFSHSGYWAVDFVLPTATGYTATVVAAKSGVVMYVKDVSSTGGSGSGFSGYANGVVIRHAPGEYSWYWHLAKNSVPADVQPGQFVEAGTVIGWMGSTGFSTGPHLHFQVSEAFVWAGCSAVTGCVARETRANRAPFNKSNTPIDFEEVANEGDWVGCGSRTACSASPVSANRLSATDGAVLHWATNYAGPGWKLRGAYGGDLPAWLRGRASSLALPEGWSAVVYDQIGLAGTAAQISASTASFVGRQPLVSISVMPGVTVTKRLRNDSVAAWLYQLGSDDARVLRIAVDGQVVAQQPCAWAIASLAPGRHDVAMLVRPDGGARPALNNQRWPLSPAACVTPPPDPGPPPALITCATVTDTLEPNDSAAAAVALTLGVTQTHRIASPGDADWIVFNTTAGVTYTLYTLQLERDSDTVMRLYSADGVTELGVSDDARGYASRIVFNASAGGPYYARLNHWDTGISGCDAGYSLVLAEGVVLDKVFMPLALRRR